MCPNRASELHMRTSTVPMRYLRRSSWGTSSRRTTSSWGESTTCEPSAPRCCAAPWKTASCRRIRPSRRSTPPTGASRPCRRTLRRPGIEITGPASITNMFINALNPGPEGERAVGDLDDDEDAAGHRLVDTVTAARNRLGAVERTLEYRDRGEGTPLHDSGRRAAVLHAPRTRAAPRRVRDDHRRQARVRRDTRHRADGVPLRTGADGARSGDSTSICRRWSPPKRRASGVTSSTSARGIWASATRT